MVAPAAVNRYSPRFVNSQHILVFKNDINGLLRCGRNSGNPNGWLMPVHRMAYNVVFIDGVFCVDNGAVDCDATITNTLPVIGIRQSAELRCHEF